MRYVRPTFLRFSHANLWVPKMLLFSHQKLFKLPVQKPITGLILTVQNFTQKCCEKLVCVLALFFFFMCLFCSRCVFAVLFFFFEYLILILPRFEHWTCRLLVHHAIHCAVFAADYRPFNKHFPTKWAIERFFKLN